MLDNSEFAEVRNVYGHLQMFALTMISNSIIQGRQTRQRTDRGRPLLRDDRSKLQHCGMARMRMSKLNRHMPSNQK